MLAARTPSSFSFRGARSAAVNSLASRRSCRPAGQSFRAFSSDEHDFDFSSMKKFKQPLQVPKVKGTAIPLPFTRVSYPSLPQPLRMYFTFLTTQRGVDVLHDPLWNKGTAFKYGERDRLRFRGLLPPRRLTMEKQAKVRLTWVVM